MTATVFCVARDEVRAMRVLDDLRNSGFSDRQITLVIPEVAACRAGASGPQGTSQQSGRFWGELPAILTSRRDTGNLICVGQPLVSGAGHDWCSQPEAELSDELSKAGVPTALAQKYRDLLNERCLLVVIRAFDLHETVRLQSVLSRGGVSDLVVVAQTSTAGNDSSGDYRQAA